MQQFQIPSSSLWKRREVEEWIWRNLEIKRKVVQITESYGKSTSRADLQINSGPLFSSWPTVGWSNCLCSWCVYRIFHGWGQHGGKWEKQNPWFFVETGAWSAHLNFRLNFKTPFFSCIPPAQWLHVIGRSEVSCDLQEIVVDLIFKDWKRATGRELRWWK